MKKIIVTGNVRVSCDCLSPLREQRMKLFDKVLIVLKALIALLELIRQFIE
ncbi:damage-inducible type I toxin DinQ [Escherichia coli]